MLSIFASSGLLSPSFIFAVEIEATLLGLLSYLFLHLINLDMFRFPFVSIGNWKQQKSNNLYFCNYRNLQRLLSCTKKDLIYFWIPYVSTVTEVEDTSDGTVTTSFIPCTHFKPYVVKYIFLLGYNSSDLWKEKGIIWNSEFN